MGKAFLNQHFDQQVQPVEQEDNLPFEGQFDH